MLWDTQIYYLHFKQNQWRREERKQTEENIVGKLREEKKKFKVDICQKCKKKKKFKTMTLLKLHSMLFRRKKIIMFHVKYVRVERIIIKFSCSPISFGLKLCFHNNFTNLSSLPLFFPSISFNNSFRCLNHTRMVAVIYWKMISFMLYRGQNREDEIKLILFWQRVQWSCICEGLLRVFHFFSKFIIKLQKKVYFFVNLNLKLICL